MAYDVASSAGEGSAFHTGIENFFCGVRSHFTQIHAPLIAGFGMVITGLP